MGTAELVHHGLCIGEPAHIDDAGLECHGENLVLGVDLVDLVETRELHGRNSEVLLKPARRATGLGIQHEIEIRP